MTPRAICVDGCTITPDTLATWRQGKTGIWAELGAFLDSWWNETPTMPLQTSGSTGKPKLLLASKAAMQASAAATCHAFHLQAGDTALLCLPLRYIAGQMMIVRALVGRLNLQVSEPCSTPLAKLAQPLSFAPMVPMQLASTLALPDAASQLSRVRSILLGGGFVDAALEAQVQSLPCQFFQSYGMTETLSHIALRALNGPQRSDYYTPLPGVRISLTPAGTLQISVPYLNIENLQTNDRAEITSDGRFRILGRVDAVINSGGIKIQAEEIEQTLLTDTGLQVLALPMPHPVLGQCIALLWEGEPQAETLLREACARLPRYHQPHHFHRCAALPRTATGKPARAQALQLLSTNITHHEPGRNLPE